MSDVVPLAPGGVSWHFPCMETARWVMVPLLGVWMTAWLQNESIDGYWVQFDADAPFRFVSEIKEIAVNQVHA